MADFSRWDRCMWRGCEASCEDDFRLCWYHFRLAGETFVEKRSVWGGSFLAERNRLARLEREAEAKEAAPTVTLEGWQQARSVVYYVRIHDHVKIGYTINLAPRMSNLRVDREALLAVEPGWKSEERSRHELFGPERVGRREDFNPSRRLMAHISAVRAKYGEPWEFAERRAKSAGPQPKRPPQIVIKR